MTADASAADPLSTGLAVVRQAGTVPAADGGSGGSAGSREPRRPRPDAGSGGARLKPPTEN
jgi:hypothetical protein